MNTQQQETLQQLLQQYGFQLGDAFAVRGIWQLVSQHQAYFCKQREVGFERDATHIGQDNVNAAVKVLHQFQEVFDSI